MTTEHQALALARRVSKAMTQLRARSITPDEFRAVMRECRVATGDDLEFERIKAVAVATDVRTYG